MLDPDMLYENLYGDEGDPDVRLECDLAWVCMSDREHRVALDAAFILDQEPIAGTMMRARFDRMVVHTRGTLALRALQAAASFDARTRDGVAQALTRLRAELDKADEAWQRARAYADVLVGDRA